MREYKMIRTSNTNTSSSQKEEIGKVYTLSVFALLCSILSIQQIYSVTQGSYHLLLAEMIITASLVFLTAVFWLGIAVIRMDAKNRLNSAGRVKNVSVQ